MELNHLHVLLVGAGNVGLEKLTAILNNSAKTRITIVAEQVASEISQYQEDYPQL
ncbi:MAG: NAD(P)-dependent oxidoreductase [Bacteroidota bacterium]